jgi:long-chain acyl-CoA synthetase
MDLFDAFRIHRNKRPHAPAFLIASGDRSFPVTWRQFTDDIAVVAWIVEKYGVKTVAILGENSYEWMVVHAACLFSGIVVVPVDVNANAQDISKMLSLVGAEFLLYSSFFKEKALSVVSMTPDLKAGRFGSRKTDGFLNAGRLAIKAGAKTIWESPSKVRSGQTSMIVFTSGTTSEPRGAELTVAGIEAFVETAYSSLKIKEDDRSLMILPLHHIYGICVSYTLLACGAVQGVCPDFRRLYDAVERFAADYLFLVPALVDVLAAKIEQHGKNAVEALGHPIRWILSGGAPLSRRIYDRMAAVGVTVLSAYGLTESTALYAIDPSEGGAVPGSSGRCTLLPSCQTRVSDKGELLIRGPSVMNGYYKRPEKTAETIDADGWLHTGDYGRIDEGGNVFVTGRISRTIILSSGKKVAPEELEEKISVLPGVLEVMVSGDGEKRSIKAEIYASENEEVVRGAISSLNLTLPVYQRIDTVIFRKEPFDRTSSGKIKLR